MTEAQEQKPLSVIGALATQHGMEKDHFEAALKATVVPAGINQAQFAAFCMVAKQYNLNPLTKEIYAFPAKGGGIVPIVSIDGWCNIINSNNALNGIDFEDKHEEGKLVSITCIIHRKDREYPVKCTEYMSECDRQTEPWKKWPARMLRHKALIQCARYAFSLSGIYDQDEAERMDMVDVTPMVTDPETGAQIKALPTPFKNHKERQTFSGKMEGGINNCESLEELERYVKENKPMMDRMRVSDDKRDDYAVGMIDTTHDMKKARLEFILEEEEKARKLLSAADKGNFDGVLDD